MRGVLVSAALGLAALLAGSAGAASHRATQATVAVFPSATSFRAASAVPAGGAAKVALNMAIGGTDDAVVLVRGAKQVSATLSLDGPLTAQLLWAHYVSFSGTPIPDALEPWDGSPRAAEQLNQPLWVQVRVPPGTAAGTFTGSLDVVADGATTTLPLSIRVFPVTLPAPGRVSGSLLTGFNVAGQSYGNKVASLYGPNGKVSSPALYAFVASYRISPNSWGYGTPTSPSGYANDTVRWWKDSAGMMAAEAGDPPVFAAMALPLGNNRSAGAVAGLSPDAPRSWCPYLRSVHQFWQQHDWLSSFPYLYGMDEAGLAGFKVVAQQAAALHRCFPGAHELVTGNPSADNTFLWDGGSDDVDVWAVLASRYYGKYTVPALSRQGKSNATEKLKLIDQVRKRHKQIWTYNYSGTNTPGFTASEPLSDSRLLFDWAALENLGGVLYGQGTTTYQSGNPLTSVGSNGSFVLIYPGRDGPIASARLEEIRNGIEDWEILNVVRRKHGAAAVGKILGGAGLFSTTKQGAVELGCTVGCQLKTSTPFSWPTWSHDTTTPARLEQMKLQALTAAS